MDRVGPHHLTLFSLKPLNERAEKVALDPKNARFASQLPNFPVLNISLNDTHTLATLGRAGEIVINEPTISKVQCTFELDLESHVVMLHDRSMNQTTQVRGPKVVPFESGRPREIAVGSDVNTQIGIGGPNGDLIQFALIWYEELSKAPGPLKLPDFSPSNNLPRFARTFMEPSPIRVLEIDDIQMQGLQHQLARYVKVDKLGSGTFGAVEKCLNVDTGKFMAVKTLKRLSNSSPDQWARDIQKSLTREVRMISWIDHPHIVKILGSEYQTGAGLKIFLNLNEGNLASLSAQGFSYQDAKSMLLQMLDALAFLATKEIIHGDVKPENILYVTRKDGTYHFQLGDFGLCNSLQDARSAVGTTHFLAPEILLAPAQTCKVDVWSLFVTLLWTLDLENFREQLRDLNTAWEVQKLVLKAAENPELEEFRGMAKLDPNERASAADMIEQLTFNDMDLD